VDHSDPLSPSQHQPTSPPLRPITCKGPTSPSRISAHPGVAVHRTQQPCAAVVLGSINRSNPRAPKEAPGPCVIRKEAWPFYRTISGVRLCWELEEPKGPKGWATGCADCRAAHPLGPLGFKCSQHSPTTRPSVERTAEKRKIFRIAFSSPVQRLVQATLGYRLCGLSGCTSEREIFIDNLLVRIHLTSR